MDSVENLSERISRKNLRMAKGLEDRVRIILPRTLRTSKDIGPLIIGMIRTMTRVYRTIWKLSDRLKKAQ